jgi:hypothetical protein
VDGCDADGGTSRLRNNVLGDAAAPTRAGRWIEETAALRSALKAAAAGRTAKTVAIAATTSPVVNAAIRCFFKVSLFHFQSRERQYGRVGFGWPQVTDLDGACKGIVQGSR